jgi:hypothetical protein
MIELLKSLNTNRTIKSDILQIYFDKSTLDILKQIPFLLFYINLYK